MATRAIRKLLELVDVDVSGAAVGDALSLDADGVTWVPAATSASSGSAFATGDKVMYVSKSGSDSNNGLSPGKPKLTITAAIAAVGRGKINVGAGTFSETIDLTGLYQIWLVGQGANGSLANGSCIQAPNATASVIYLSSTGGQHIIEGFTLQGYPTGNVYTGKILNYAGGQGYCTFRNIKVDGNTSNAACSAGTYGGTGVYVKNTENNVFEDFTIDNCNLALHVDSNVPGGTNSQNTFRSFFFGPNYKVFKEFESTPGSYGTGRNIYEKWKGSGCWIDADDGWGIEMNGQSHIYDSIDLTEPSGVAFPTGSGRIGWKINSCNSHFRACGNASTTDITVTGDDNLFDSFQVGGVFTVDSGAVGNVVSNFYGQGGDFTPDATHLFNNGTGTKIKNMKAGGWSEAGLGTIQGVGAPPVSASGYWYATPAAPTSSVVMVANRMYLLPIWVPEISKSISIGLHIVSGASGNAEAGIYAAGVDNLPGAYKWPIGDPTSTASPGDITFTNWRGHVGVAGLIWLAVVCNAAPTVTGVASGSAPTPFVGDATLATMTGGAAQAFYVDAAYNGTFPYLGASTASLAACGNAPTIYYKFG